MEVPIDYKGFEIPNEFVVGYGLIMPEIQKPALCGGFEIQLIIIKDILGGRYG